MESLLNTHYSIADLHSLKFMMLNQLRSISKVKAEESIYQESTKPVLTRQKCLTSEIAEKAIDRNRGHQFRATCLSNLAQISRKVSIKKATLKIENSCCQRLSALLLTSSLADNVKSHLASNYRSSDLSEYLRSQQYSFSFELDAKRIHENVLKLKKILLKLNQKESVSDLSRMEIYKRAQSERPLQSLDGHGQAPSLPPIANGHTPHSQPPKLNGIDSSQSLKKLSNLNLPSHEGPSTPHHNSSLREPLAHRGSVTSVNLPSASFNQPKAISKDPKLRELIRPYYELNQDVNYYNNFYQHASQSSHKIPPSFEQFLLYVPNYHIIQQIAEKEKNPNSHSPADTLVNALKLHSHDSKSLQQNVYGSIERFIDHIRDKIARKEEFFIPISMSANNILFEALRDISEHNFLLVVHKEHAFQVTTFNNIKDPFFTSIPEAFAKNPLLLYFVHRAERMFGSHVEYITNYITSIPILKGLNLSSEMIMRLIIFTVFLRGHKIFELIDSRVKDDFLFKQAAKFFPELRNTSHKSSMGAQMLEFKQEISEAHKINPNDLFSRQAMSSSGSCFYKSRVIESIKKTAAMGKSMEIETPTKSSVMNRPTRITINWNPSRRFIDKSQKYDYKKLAGFKKHLNNGKLNRVPEKSQRGEK